ncbi:MAG: hypothetical protein OQK81_03185 [Candidatus Bathyarchaeota archaeon]|nr:hypothetical protein [Candidatus Bathyarchaeota archaeon]
MENNKIILFSSIIVLLIVALIVGTILLTGSEDKTKTGELYSFPISVGEKIFIVSVLSNYSSSPEVSYSEESKSVYLDFTGDKENSFFNVTVPTDLIGGEISLINKYYEVSAEYVTQSYNGTHNSVFFNFDQSAYVKHFEIKGTEGATTDSN